MTVPERTAEPGRSPGWGKRRFWTRQLLWAVPVVPSFWVVMWLLWEQLGVGGGAATGFASVLTTLLVVHAVLHGRMLISGYFQTDAGLGLAAGVWAAMPAVGATGIGVAVLHLHPLAAGALGLGAGAVAFVVVRRPSRTAAQRQAVVHTQLRSLDEIDSAIAACRAQLLGGKLTGEQRIVVEINLAAAQSEGGLLADRPDVLDEALTTLDRFARDSGLALPLRLRAVSELVSVRDLQAERHRVDHGYADALDLQLRLASEPRAPTGVLARAWSDQAQYRLYLLRQKAERGEAERADIEAVRTALSAALSHPGLGREMAAHLRLELTQLELTAALFEPGSADLVPVMARRLREIRAAGAVLDRRGSAFRDMYRLTLAVALLTQAQLSDDPGDDLDEAERIVDELVRGRPELRGQAHELRAQIVELRLETGPEVDRDGRTRNLVRERLQSLRAAHRYYRDLSVIDLRDSARVWADAAVEAGDTVATAEAYARLAAAVPVDVLRRLSWDERERVLAASQGTGTEAGYWLCAAGRVEDAVVAIENARAILVGQRARRLPADLAERLAAAGRPDVHQRYRQAAEELADSERRAHRGSPGSVPVGPSAEQRAWSGFDRALREVDQVLGRGAREIGFEQVRRAAARSPIVYLAAAERGGFAVIVLAGEPARYLVLPQLTRAALERRITEYQGCLPLAPLSERRFAALLSALWSEVMEPVLTGLPGVGSVTLIPLGGLALLPLHAAGGPARYVDEQVVVRYAPSALVARQAELDAERADRRRRAVLAVDVPRTDGLAELRFSEAETRAICRQYAPFAVRLPDATHDGVLAALPDASVWHFACHGRNDPASPLDSALRLADEPLTLRELFARSPGVHRLAVLSACETGIPDVERLDEVIGFPAALLQAGVAGVVATGWRVDDAAAMFLVIRLHELLVSGRPPDEALSTAQRWLRAASNRELRELLPSQRQPPVRASAQRRERWFAQRPFAHPRYWGAFAFTGA